MMMIRVDMRQAKSYVTTAPLAATIQFWRGMLLYSRYSPMLFRHSAARARMFAAHVMRSSARASRMSMLMAHV